MMQLLLNNTILKSQAIFCLAFLLLAGCKSPSDKVLEDFNKVKKSLDSAANLIDTTKGIGAFSKYDKHTIDSLDLIFRNATLTVQTLKLKLQKEDKKGERLDLAEKLLYGTSEGDRLYVLMMSVYKVAITNEGIEMSKRDEYLQAIQTRQSKWLEQYFRLTPTIAAITILNKLQNDIDIISAATWGVDKKEVKIK